MIMNATDARMGSFIDISSSILYSLMSKVKCIYTILPATSILLDGAPVSWGILDYATEAWEELYILYLDSSCMEFSLIQYTCWLTDLSRQSTSASQSQVTVWYVMCI